MKQYLLLASLLFLPTPVLSQQINTYRVCTQYREVYVPGVYDSYGNYTPGSVYTQSYNVPCGYNYNQYRYRPRRYYGRYTNPNCNPTRTLFGTILGGAIGNALANPSNRGWPTALGASIGGLTFAC